MQVTSAVMGLFFNTIIAHNIGRFSGMPFDWQKKKQGKMNGVDAKDHIMLIPIRLPLITQLLKLTLRASGMESK